MTAAHPMHRTYGQVGFGVPLRTLHAALQEHTYKPGYGLSLDVNAVATHGCPYLTLTTQVPDSYHPERVVRLNYREPVPHWACEDREGFLAWVFEFLCRFERHEAAEWWKWQGRPVNDPHRERR